MHLAGIRSRHLDGSAPPSRLITLIIICSAESQRISSERTSDDWSIGRR